MEFKEIFKHLDTWSKKEEMLEALHEWAEDNDYTHSSGFSMTAFKNGEKYRFHIEEANIEFVYDTYSKLPYKIIYSLTHDNIREPVSWENLWSYFNNAMKHMIKIEKKHIK